jgi:hypothetical protein
MGFQTDCADDGVARDSYRHLVQTATAIVSSLIALVSVGLGVALTARVQERSWKREDARRDHDSIRDAYVAFFVAARRFRSFMEGRDIEILAASRETPRPPIPIFGADAGLYKDALETAWANLLLTARGLEVVEEARILRRALSDHGVARAKYGAGAIPEAAMDEVRNAERRFRKAARVDLGLPALEE